MAVGLIKTPSTFPYVILFSSKPCKIAYKYRYCIVVQLRVSIEVDAVIIARVFGSWIIGVRGGVKS